MSIKNPLNSYLVVGDDGPQQLLLYFERPSFSFKVGQQYKATWSPVMFEMPVNLLQTTKDWIDQGFISSLSLIVTNIDAHVIEEWAIKDAKKLSSCICRGKMVDYQVTRLVIGYEWAQKRK